MVGKVGMADGRHGRQVGKHQCSASRHNRHEVDRQAGRQASKADVVLVVGKWDGGCWAGQV